MLKFVLGLLRYSIHPAWDTLYLYQREQECGVRHDIIFLEADGEERVILISIFVWCLACFFVWFYICRAC